MKKLAFKSITSTEIIEIITFNYDGAGNALVRSNGELKPFSLSELKDVLFGKPYEAKQYTERADLQ